MEVQLNNNTVNRSLSKYFSISHVPTEVSACYRGDGEDGVWRCERTNQGRQR